MGILCVCVCGRGCIFYISPASPRALTAVSEPLEFSVGVLKRMYLKGLEIAPLPHKMHIFDHERDPQ